jgi:hypothetical protein
VIPITLSENWNLITRIITAIINRPALASGVDAAFGLGDMNEPVPIPFAVERLHLGVAPTFTLPTATEGLSVGKWSMGPTAVTLTMQGAPGSWAR